MLDQIGRASGTALALAEYRAAFWNDWKNIPDRFDKIERGQTGAEPGNPSWAAFTEGDWDRAVDLMQTADKATLYSPDARTDIPYRRLRVIEWPLSAYLHWELHFLRRNAVLGQDIRVIDAAALAPLETHGQIPDLAILGPYVMYQVLYDADGALAGGRRITNHELITGCRDQFDQLWETGEDLHSYFPREIAHLPPPMATSR